MARLRGGYQRAKSCTSGPQPGAWGQMDWYLHNYKDLGGVNSGIYNCRPVRGGRTTSLHGEGRACDNGVRPYSAEYGTKLANAIVNNSRELGVQCVIFNRKIWSSSYPDQWRNYTGVASHVDHLHVEFTWASAKRARAAQRELWAKILGGGAGGGTGTSGGSRTYTTVNYGQLLKLYTKGNPVKDVQVVLKAHGYDLGKGGVDGYYGTLVKTGVEAFQKKNGLTVDGIVGPKTWNKIKADPAFKSHRPATPKVPAFPLGKGEWMGRESNNPKNRSGALAKDRPAIRAAQRRLLNRGWSGVGKADGIYGPKMEKVVRQFQREKGLTVDGLLGLATWKAMWTAPVT